MLDLSGLPRIGATKQTRLVLVRHGETDWNAEGRWQGWSDRPLTDRGRRQAHAVAARLGTHRFDAIYSSDLQRAVGTAELVGKGRGLTVDRQLREQHFGILEGVKGEHLTLAQPGLTFDIDGAPLNPAEGEGARNFHGRIRDTLRRVASRHPSASILVVAHGGVLLQALRAFGRAPADQRLALPANCGTVELAIDGAEPS